MAVPDLSLHYGQINIVIMLISIVIIPVPYDTCTDKISRSFQDGGCRIIGQGTQNYPIHQKLPSNSDCSKFLSK